MLRFALLPTLAAAFGFGDFKLPSIPIPSDFQRYLSEIPSIPADFITELPTINLDNLASLIPEMPSIPNFNRSSAIPIPSLPEFPSLPPLPSMRELPSQLSDFINSAVPAINDALKSLGVSPLPTIRVPSSFPEMPSLNPEDLKQGYEDAAAYWRANHTLKVPESEAELKDLIRDRSSFNMTRAEQLLDRLGEQSGYDVHGSVRMIAALILTNQSADSVYERTTREFTMAATRMREIGEQTFRIAGLDISLPAALAGANQTLSVIQHTGNPYAALSSQPINGSVISIMIGDLLGNETNVRDLASLINFTVPGVGDACVFWNETEVAWSGEGCRVLGQTEAATLCGCNHLTDFTVISIAPQVATVQSASSHPMQPLIVSQSTSSRPSDLVLGLAVGGALVGAVLIAALVMNIRHAKENKNKRLTVKPTGWAVSPLNTVAVRL